MTVAFEARQSDQNVLVLNFFPREMVAPAFKTVQKPRMDAEE
jgi:hypothetical protein